MTEKDYTTFRSWKCGFGVVLMLLLALAGTGCGDDKPTAPTMPTTPVPASMTSVVIAGNLTLTEIGQTSQLVATARFSDGTTKNVTSEGAWRSDNNAIATVSPGGVLTMVGFGASSVSFTHQLPPGRTAYANFTATPPGTFALRGRVSEPGAGGVAIARVTDVLSGRFATTDSMGLFSLAELPRLPARFKVEEPSYEPIEMEVVGGTSVVELRIQRVVRLTAGEKVTPAPLAPNDLSYLIGADRCVRCRLIRVVVPQSGTVRVRVTSGAKLKLWVEGQVVTGEPGQLTAEVPVNAPREVLMYLGISGGAPFGDPKQVFTFETSLL